MVAHAFTDEAIRQSIDAGVQCIEHGNTGAGIGLLLLQNARRGPGSPG